MAIFTNEIRTILTAKDGGAASTLGKFEKQTEATSDAWDKLANKVGISGETLKKGLSSLGTVALGAGLVTTLKGAADAYVEAAEGANMLAQATNASVEDASRFNAVATNMGLGMNDLVEIFSDFQQAAAQSSKELAGMGVEMSKTSSGQTDWIATATSFLTKVQSISDATERNRLLFKFFGEEGAKQLMGLVNSGQSVAEALKAVSDQKILTSEDVRAAQEYTRNMQQLEGAASALGESLGRSVVPALSAMADFGTKVAGVVSQIHGSTLLIGGLAVVFARYQTGIVRAAQVSGGAMRTLGKAAVKPLTVDFTGLTIAAGASAKALDANTAAAARAKGGAAGAVSAMTKGLFLAAVAWEVLSSAVDSYNSKLEATASSTVEITTATAEELQDQMSLWEKFGHAVKDLINPQAWLDTLTFGLAGEDPTESLKKDLEETKRAEEEAAAAAEKLTEARGPAAVAAKKQGDAEKVLVDLIAGGVGTQQQYADAVTAAATAQEANATNTKAAKDAVDGFLASTKNAWETTLSLIDSVDARKDAWDAYQESLKGVSQAEKDASDAASSRADAAKSQADAVKRARDAVGEARKADDKKSTEASRAALKRAQEGLADAQADQAKGQKERSAEAVEAQEKQTKAVKDTNEAVVDSAKRYADAAVKAAEGQARMEGGTLDVRDAHDLYIESLKKAKKESDTKTQRDEIQKLITKLEEAQTTAGEGIKIGDIRFKEGTTKKQLDKLKGDIGRAYQSGQTALARTLEKDYEALKAAPKGAIPIAFVGPTGKPLTEPIPATITPAVSPDSATKTNEDLLKLTGDREAKINATVHNQQNTINVLDGLAGDREMTITVHYKIAPGETPPGVEGETRRATSSAASLLAGPSVGALTATQPIPVAGQQMAAGVTYSPTIVNNYPAPERASDSVAASLRIARYAVGL